MDPVSLKADGGRYDAELAAAAQVLMRLADGAGHQGGICQVDVRGSQDVQIGGDNTSASSSVANWRKMPLAGLTVE